MRGDPDQMIGRRKTVRLGCEIGVEVKDSASQWQRAVLHDIAPTGFMLATGSWSPSKESLWLSIPGLEPFPAKVRWREGTRIGCQFLLPLEQAAFVRIKTLVDSYRVANARDPG